MGLGSLGSLNVLLSADTAQFTSAMDKAAHVAEKNFKKIGITANLSLVALAAAFVANTKAALTFGDGIADMSKRLGMSTESLSKLAYAAKMSDVPIETLENSIRKMYLSAYKGTPAFDALGVTVRSSTGRMRDGVEIFKDVSEAFLKMPDGIGKANAAIQIFGKTGTDIVPLLNEGIAGLNKYAEEAKKFGVVISDESAKNAERFDDMMKKAGEALKGLGVRTVDAIGAIVQAFKLVYMSSEEYQKSIEDYRKKVEEAADASQSSAEASAAQAQAYELAADAAEKQKKMLEDGTKLTESMRTAQEKYNDDLEYYHTLLAGGAITQETYKRAAKDATDTLYEQTKKTSNLAEAGKDLGWSFASAFENAIIEGKKFSDVLTGLAQDIERILLRQMITQPIANAISGMFTASPTKAVAVTTASKHGNVFSGGSVMPFAMGGVINRPTLFPMANGGTGLAGEAGKEAILPLARTASGDLGVKSSGGGKVEVNVYAPAGSSVKKESKMDGDREVINIMIDEAVAGHIGDSGSKTHRSLKNTFAVSQALTRR